jgi:hypothetical protein
VNKRRSHRFRREGLNQVVKRGRRKEKYCVEVSNRFRKILMLRRKLILIGKRLKRISNFQPKRV